MILWFGVLAAWGAELKSHNIKKVKNHCSKGKVCFHILQFLNIIFSVNSGYYIDVFNAVFY